MMLHRALHIAKTHLVALMLVALGTIGLAHSDDHTSIDPSMLAFLQMGGTMDDICAEGHEKRALAQEGCEFCRLSDVDTPQRAIEMPWAPVAISALYAGAQTATARLRNSQHGPARAPPFVV